MDSHRPVQLYLQKYRSNRLRGRRGKSSGEPGLIGRPHSTGTRTISSPWQQPATHFPRMRTLHDSRRDWLSEEELWLAIPEGETNRHCLTHAPRLSWKMMVEFFLALNSNLGSWIHNLERRDLMLLGSLTENIFGFTGTYARRQQASLTPILVGWKRWKN